MSELTLPWLRGYPTVPRLLHGGGEDPAETDTTGGTGEKNAEVAHCILQSVCPCGEDGRGCTAHSAKPSREGAPMPR